MIGGKREIETILSVAIFIFFLAACVPIYLFANRPEEIDLLGNIMQFIGLVFAVFCFFRARLKIEDPQIRQACLLFCFGFSLWAFGQLFVLYSETLLHRVSTGTVSSAYFLIGYSIMVVGLYTLARRSAARDQAKALKAAIVTGVTILAITAIIWKPVIGSGRIYIVLDVAYAILDLISIGLTFFLLQLAWSSENPSAIKAYTLLLSGFMAVGISNFIGMDAEFGTLLYRGLDLCYFFSYFLLSLAGASLAKA